MFHTPKEERQAGLYEFKTSLVRHNKFQASGDKQSETPLQTTKEKTKQTQPATTKPTIKGYKQQNKKESGFACPTGTEKPGLLDVAPKPSQLGGSSGTASLHRLFPSERDVDTWCALHTYFQTRLFLKGVDK